MGIISHAPISQFSMMVIHLEESFIAKLIALNQFVCVCVCKPYFGEDLSLSLSLSLSHTHTHTHTHTYIHTGTHA